MAWHGMAWHGMAWHGMVGCRRRERINGRRLVCGHPEYLLTSAHLGTIL